MFNHTSMLLYNRMERHVKQRQSLLDITDAGMLITTVLLQYKVLHGIPSPSPI